MCIWGHLGEYSLPQPQRWPLDAATRERLSRCVDKIRGFGARKLTEQEICKPFKSIFQNSFLLARWRQLISNDVLLQRRILEARNVEELKAMCEHPDYRLYFTRVKWSVEKESAFY